MNEAHLELCASAEWAEAIESLIIPWVMEGGIELGNELLEVGPGPGATTNALRDRVPQLHAVELDPALAAKLEDRFAGTNVTIHRADATDMPFGSGRFSAAASFTMLHHVPTIDLQDRLFAEVARVLRPGGVFFGGDSLDSPLFRDLHTDDICNPLDPSTLGGRLEAAGFTDVEIAVHPDQPSVRFRARHGAG